MPKPSILTIDDREPKTMQAAVRESVPSARLARMAIGDFQIIDAEDHVLVIERKDVADLLHSIADGRLAHQIPNLAMWDHKLLIIEGCWRLGPEGQIVLPRKRDMGADDMDTLTPARVTRWKPANVQMILLGIQRSLPDLFVLHTSSPSETVDTLRVLESRARKGCVLLPAKR